MINGQIVGEFDSNPVKPYTTVGIQGVGVETMTFTTVGLIERDWISLFEASDSPCKPCRMGSNSADYVVTEAVILQNIPKNDKLDD